MKTIYLSKPVLFCLSLFVSAYSFAGTNKQLLLKTGVVNTTENLEQFIQTPVGPEETVNARYYRIIQFYQTPTTEQKNRIEQTGVKLLSYLPEGAFYSSIPFSLDRQVLKNSGIKSVIKINSEYKLADNLLHPNYPASALSDNDKQIDLVIQFFKDINPLFVMQAIEGKKIYVISHYEHVQLINIRIAISRINEIADLPFVKWMEIYNPISTPDDTRARGLHRANALASDYALGRHYDGSGVSIALGDDGIVGPHIDFTGRLDNSNASGTGATHGDMTSGILTGAGNLNPVYRGMATGAYEYNYDIPNAPYPHLMDMPTTKTTLGIRIGSTSYSQSNCAEYSTFSQTGDQLLHQNPELIWVFSCGNNGFADCYGAGPGWGNITGGYKNGKNVIACANLNYADVLEGSSSRGPSNDGRIKPDIAANGIDQMSTDENNTYQVGGGTSASCPGIAGITAQLYQAYRELNSGADPDACLLKACMLNTAEDLGNAGPDYLHGWGRVNALRAVKTLEENRYISDSISQGGTNVITLTVPAFASKFKVMLYWLDVEGDPVASKALVNDLDLTVTDPSSVVLNPYILDPTANAVNLNTPATTGIDNLNNMEQVELNAPSNGTYTITVTGTNIPMGPQKYYIVYEICNDEITVTYPNGGESYVPGEVETIRWDSFGAGLGFDLEYSTDSGTTWNLITTGVAPTTRFYDWTVPATITGKALVKVTRGTVSGQSGQTFSIMDVPDANLASIDFACVDSMQISWPAVANATGYVVYRLGSKYMDSLGYTANTFFTITSNYTPLTTEWFSISALGANEAMGRRSIAFNKGPGLQNCNLAVDESLLSVYPANGTIYSSCDNLTGKFITVDLKNEATTPVSNVQISYSINGGPVVTETNAGTLNGGAHLFYNFIATYDFSAIGSYDLVVYVNDTSDQNHFNDTLFATIQTIQGLYTMPWSEDFETFDSCSTVGDCEATICAMENGFINDVNGTDDDIDWRTNAGPTPSGGTGPDIDHNPGNAGGRYLYTEASGLNGGNPCTARLAQLESPCIDLTGGVNPRLTFWYHMFGANMGELHLDLFNNGTLTTDIIPAVSGDQGNTWHKGTLDLTPYAGNVVKFRFRGITGLDYDSDIAIDDINVSETPAVDAGIDAVNPANGTVLSSCDDNSAISVTINILNDGLSTLTNTPVYYQVNGGTIQTNTFPGPLAPNASVPFTFTSTSDFSGVATYNIAAWISDPTDVNHANDTIFSVIQTIQTLFAFPWNEDCESFDLCSVASDCQLTICDLKNGLVNLTNGIDDDIDWRTNEGSTPTNNSGPDVDHTEGTVTGNYLYTEASLQPGGCLGQLATLVSPCIDLTGSTNPELGYWYHMFGQTMGEMHTDLFVNGAWIDDVIPTVSGDQGDVWLLATYNLSAYVGDIIKFRIRGITGQGTQSDMALDGFAVYEQTSVDETHAAGNIFIAPNPGNGVFNIVMNRLIDKNLNLSITDLQGKNVYSRNFVSQSPEFRTKLDLSNLAKGIYTVRAISGGKIYYVKLSIL